MKKQLLLILFVSLIFFLNAQNPPDTLWTKTFGGSNSDRGSSVDITADSGYIITGNNGYDIWLIKTNANGDEIWNQTFSENYFSKGKSVIQTADNGYIITGFTGSSTYGDIDIWLIKTNPDGIEEWSNIFIGSDMESGESVIQTSDGGYIITGFAGSYEDRFNALLIKTDSNGNEEWYQTYGESNFGTSYSVQQTIDGGYIMTGFAGSFSNGDSDVCLFKTDSNGNEEWNQTFGGYTREGGHSVQQTSDSGYIIAGYTDDWGYDSDIWLIKTDSEGQEEWNQTFGGDLWDISYCIQQTIDDGFIVAGVTTSYGNGSNDIWLIKIDSQGNEEWNRTFGGSNTEYGRSIKQTLDGGFIVIGWTRSYGAGSDDVWLLRLDSDVSIENNEITTPSYLVQNYPNPFNPTTTIEFSIQNNSNVELGIYNIKGQKVKTLVNDNFEKGIHSILWNGNDESGDSVSSGVYMYKLNVNGKTEIVRKCLLLK